jgi:hypothetical protein
MQQRYCDSIAARFLSMDPVSTDANTGRRSIAKCARTTIRIAFYRTR